MKLHGALADLLALVHTYGTINPQAPATIGVSPSARLPKSDRGWDFGHIPVVDPVESAVLVLFGSMDDTPANYGQTVVPEELDVLLTQRSMTLRNHPGQVSFPGGRRDPEDDTFTACAVRETQEETGADPAGIKVLGELPKTPLSVTNFQVVPVIAWWEQPSQVSVIDDNEATRVFRVPVADLVNAENRVTTVITRPGTTGEIGDFRGPAFTVSNTLVWGFTAILLDRILHLLGWSQPWDRSREIDVTNWNATQPVPPITRRRR